MPKRIQLRRTKGWKMPPNTVKVDRSTRWGNPLRCTAEYSAADAVRDYRRWLLGDRTIRSFELSIFGAPPTVLEIKSRLGGKNLGCWCPHGAACHADVLLEIANNN